MSSKLKTDPRRDFRTLEARAASVIVELRNLEISTRYATYSPLFCKVRSAPNLDELELIVLKLDGALLREKAEALVTKHRPLKMATEFDTIISNFPLLWGTDKLETARKIFDNIQRHFRTLKSSSENIGNMGKFKLSSEGTA
ncbi:MAG: hypothetical protein ABIG39_06970 [Candidatus Micrarchaeota archaeon]